MSLSPELAFGTEEVQVGDVTKELDVCGLADEMYDALGALPSEVTFNEDLKAAGQLVNKVLAKNGFPPIERDIVAYHFSQKIIGRALELKKLACNAWDTAAEPALPDAFPASE
jgi:hypothetical protein